MRTQPIRSRVRPLPRLVVLVAACLLPTACAAAGPGLPEPRVPPPDRGADHSADAAPVRTRAVVGPPAAGVELETVSAGSRRHTVLRTVAGVVIEYRIDGADWFVRGGIAGTGVPTDRWVHVDLVELATAGVEVPGWMSDPADDAGFVFELAPGDVHAGEVVAAVERARDARSVTVVFVSGLRAHGERMPLPAGTVVDLPPATEVVELRDLVPRR